METHFLQGSKQEISEDLARISGEVRAAIVFVENDTLAKPAAPVDDGKEDDIFAEMRPFMVDVEHLNDSREAIYTRVPGE